MLTLSPFDRRSFALFAAVCAIGAAACGNTIVTGGTNPDPEPGVGGSGGPGIGVGAGGSFVVGDPSAVAVWGAYGGPPGGGGAGNAGGWGGYGGGMGGYYPGGAGGCGGAGCYDGSPVLWLKVGNTYPGCYDSFDYSCTSVTTWEVTIGLPQGYQSAGIYSLENPAIMTQMSATGSENDPGPNATCWGLGGGGPMPGTIEIHPQQSSSSVTFTLSGIQESEFEANGTYSAPVCNTP